MSDENEHPPRGSWFEPSLPVALLLCVIGGILPAFFLFGPGQFVKRGRPVPRNACIANLKQIDGAVQQWALENKKNSNAAPVMSGVVQYLKGSVMPVCPLGGIYRPGRTVSDPPTCSVRGHTL